MRKSLATIDREASSGHVPPLMVDVPTAAIALGQGQTSVWTLVKNREIVAVRVGRRRLITWASLEAYVERLASEAEANMPDDTAA